MLPEITKDEYHMFFETFDTLGNGTKVSTSTKSWEYKLEKYRQDKDARITYNHILEDALESNYRVYEYYIKSESEAWFVEGTDQVEGYVTDITLVKRVVFELDISQMPLYINDSNLYLKTAAIWRLKINK